MLTVRLWTALVLLAGVFALHGVQCATGGTDPAGRHVAAAPSGHAGAVMLATSAPEAAQVAAGMTPVGEQSLGHPAATLPSPPG